MGIFLIVTFLVLMIAGVPIAFVIGLTGLASIAFSPGGMQSLGDVPQELFLGLNSFTFLTIPLFIFAASLMSTGGVAGRLMNLARTTVGRGRGGLGASAIISTMFFHGISGSSTADTAAVTRVTLPELHRQGYSIPFGTAIIAAAGATATLVPPTVDLIIMGVVANISILGLFAGGLLPAAVNAFGLIFVVVFISRRRGYGTAEARLRFRALCMAVLRAVPAALMAVIILGGILSGVFTPTESSAVAVVYGLIVSAFVYRDLKLRMLPTVIRETVELSGVVLLVIAMANILGYGLTINQIPQELAAHITSAVHGQFLFLLLVQALFLVVGVATEGVPAIIILMPILTPVATAFGISPIHFGILVEANIALGLIIPPLGLCLYAACAVSHLPLEHVVKPLLPMIGILLVTMLVITYVGAISTVVPNMLGLSG